ncbi:MAG: hypothetical protein NC314_03210 [Roseburia sp.]|nr:hypothetical protein [Roseburia sp.]MCM1241822.1 hypothetical protein [Roseburia sp.]
MNPSIIGFLFAVLFYMILVSGEKLFYTGLDSFLHWGMFSKTVFYDHNLDVWNGDLWVNHMSYPHGMASWYSLFALGKSTYTERDVMLSINVLLFACSCPVVDIAACKLRRLFSGRKIYAFIAYPVSGISVASFLWIWRFGEGVWPYISGYMDIPLGVAFMAALCLAVSDSEACYRKAFAVSLLSAALVMIKPSGIIFVSVVCLVYLINEYISEGFSMTKDCIGKLFRRGMLVVSVSLLELVIWNIMLQYRGIKGDQFSLKAFLPGTLIAKYQADTAYAELWRNVIGNFFTAFFTREVVLHISAFGWMMICAALTVLTILLLEDRREKKNVLYVNVCMIVLFCLYNLFLLWTYLTTMSEGEALGIKCYDRYIGSYIIGWFVLCIYFLFYYNVKAKKGACLFVGIFFLCNIFGFLDRRTFLKEIDSEIEGDYELSLAIRGCIPEAVRGDSGEMPDLWITYADEEEALDYGQMVRLKYYLFPDLDLYNIYGTQEDYQRQMRDIIAEFSFDYVVLYGVNEDFYNAYYWFFADGLSNAREQYENGRYQAYKVIKDENTDEFCWFEPILDAQE